MVNIQLNMQICNYTQVNMVNIQIKIDKHGKYATKHRQTW